MCFCRICLGVRVEVCARLSAPGYILLNLNEMDHDAAAFSRQGLRRGADGVMPMGEEEDCFLAQFEHISVGEGVHALQFSARDEALEPLRMESETCYLDLQPDDVCSGAAAAPSAADGRAVDGRGRLTSGGFLSCLPHPPSTLHGSHEQSMAQDSSTSSSHRLSGHGEAAWARFDRFVEVVCAKCKRRGMECGCLSAEEHAPDTAHGRRRYANVAFDKLAGFVHSMLQARDAGAAGHGGQLPAPAGRVILHLYKQGLGNQLLSLVNGLILCLLTDRVLAVHVHTRQVCDSKP
jgi:hypothetical protein